MMSRTFKDTLPQRPLPVDAGLVKPVKVRLQPLTAKEELLAWAARILPHAPYCISMFNNLMQYGRGHSSNGVFYIFRDFPDFHAVVWEWKYSPTSQYVGVFCPEEEVEQLTEALAAAPFVDWRARLIISHIPPYLLSPLQRLAEEKGSKMNLCYFNVFTYHLLLDTEPLRLEPGFRVCRLGTAGLRRVLQTTKFDHDMPLEVLCGLAQSLPYLGVYLDMEVTESTTVNVSSLSVAGEEEVPVAWSVSGFVGDAARTETVPEFRRRGLGGLITTAVARAQAGQLGFIPHSIVAKDNSASRAMFTRRAGWRHTHKVAWLWDASH